MADDLRSEVGICNTALGRIGHTKFLDTIEGDPTSVAMECCQRLYPLCRDRTLEDFEWPEATRRYIPAQLAGTTLDSGAVPSGWIYAYARPDDAIAMRRIYPGGRNVREDEEIPFDEEYDGKTDQRILLTDSDAPEWIYTAAITRVDRFSRGLASAIAWLLAHELVLPLKKDAELGAEALKMYAFTLDAAAAVAGRARRKDQPPLPYTLAVR